MADIELADALTQLFTVNVTTGASPVDVELQDPSIAVIVVNITTGGTGDVEVINLPNQTLDENGSNIPATGQRYILGIVTQTDPEDVVKVTQNGVDDWDLYNTTGPYLTNFGFAAVLLDFGGATMGAIWQNYQWGLDISVSGWNFSNTVTTGNVTLQAPEVTSSGGTGAGGTTKMAASNALAGSGAAGGDGIIHLGTGDGAGRNGIFKIENFPTADPHVAGAWWSNAGVVTVSAG